MTNIQAIEKLLVNYNWELRGRDGNVQTWVTESHRAYIRPDDNCFVVVRFLDYSTYKYELNSLKEIEHTLQLINEVIEELNRDE